MVSGVCFRDGTLAHWVTHSVGVSLMTPQRLVVSTPLTLGIEVVMLVVEALHAIIETLFLVPCMHELCFGRLCIVRVWWIPSCIHMILGQYKVRYCL